jgi:hypothetical protein
MAGFMQTNSSEARCHWLTPVTLAPWEAEMGRIAVLGQPGQKNFARVHLNRNKLSMVVRACHLSYGRNPNLRGPFLPGQKQAPI